MGKRKKKADEKIEISQGLQIGQARSQGTFSLRTNGFGKNKKRTNVLGANRFACCAVRGFLVFLVVFGALGGFLSAFHLDYNSVFAGSILFVFALYFSGLFAFSHNRYKDTGYLLFFVLYVCGIYLLKGYVNSGFAAIVNVVKQRGEVYFDLNTGTEFAENIDERYQTVTLAFLFIGLFLVLLLNIFVSNYMSLQAAVWIALPMYMIPLYFQTEPDSFYVWCMLGGLVGICFLRFGGHFKAGKSKQEFEAEKKGDIVEVSYTQNSHAHLGVLLAVLSCVLLVGFFSLCFTESDYQAKYTENRFKTATRDTVSGFLMIGFRVFFPSYYQHGGMSGGNLGNISALRPENKTDLTVIFAPYDTNPVYLKAYTGLYYDSANSRWLDVYSLTNTKFGNSQYFLVESLQDEAEQLAKQYKKDPEHNGKGIMGITNNGADTSYLYYPYFTLFSDKSIAEYTENESGFYVPSAIGQTTWLTYYPNLDYEAEITEDTSAYEESAAIRSSGYSVYTEVPEENEEAVDEFLKNAGISDADTDSDVVDKVVNYFQTEYSYSYSPGRLPENKDFVNYFLQTNKKGICSHFASAATLIFRRLGIPARYVEGYAFDYTKVITSEEVQEASYSDYYSGYSKLDKQSVRSVNVTDANAHAWVEIYEQGKGWVIVDPTPAATEQSTEEESSGLWESVQNFWENSPDIRIGGFSGWNLNFLKSHGVYLLIVLVAFGGGICLIFLLVRAIYHFACWHTNDRKRNLLWYYGAMCGRKSRRDREFAKLSVPTEQIAYLVEHGRKKSRKELNAEVMAQRIEKICFGPDVPNRTEYREVMRMLAELRKLRRIRE